MSTHFNRVQSAPNLYELYDRFERTPTPPGTGQRFSSLARAVITRQATSRPSSLPSPTTDHALIARCEVAIDIGDEDGLLSLLGKRRLSEQQCSDLLLRIMNQEAKPTSSSLATIILSCLPTPQTNVSELALMLSCGRLKELFPRDIALLQQIQRLKIPL